MVLLRNSKKILSLILLSTLLCQTSLVYAVDNQVVTSDTLKNDKDVIDFNNFNTPNEQNGDIAVKQNTLNFTFITKEDKEVEFSLADSLEEIKQELDKFKQYDSESITKEEKALNQFYNNVSFVCEIYKDSQPEEMIEFKRSVLYNTLNYVFADIDGEDGGMTGEKIGYIADIILGIDSEIENPFSDEETNSIIDEFSLKLEDIATSKDIVFINLLEKDENATNTETDTDNRPEFIENTGEAIDEAYLDEPYDYIDPSIHEGESSSVKNYVSNWDKIIGNDGASNYDSRGKPAGEKAGINNEDELANIQQSAIYAAYDDGVQFPLGISITNGIVDFSKEKAIMSALFKDVKSKNKDYITDYLIDSSKLMISANGELIISSMSTEGKRVDNFQKVYEPLNINIIFQDVNS